MTFRVLFLFFVFMLQTTIFWRYLKVEFPKFRGIDFKNEIERRHGAAEPRGVMVAFRAGLWIRFRVFQSDAALARPIPYALSRRKHPYPKTFQIAKILIDCTWIFHNFHKRDLIYTRRFISFNMLYIFMFQIGSGYDFSLKIELFLSPSVLMN